MALKVDHSQANTFGALPKGDYELYFKGAKADTTSNGNPILKTVLVIRDDIDQQGGGLKQWHNLVVTEKTFPTFVQSFLKAVKYPDGAEFEDYTDVVAKLKDHVIGLPVVANLGLQADNPQYNEIKYLKQSEHNDRIAIPDEEVENGKPLDISDEDLPF
jgi:hypothetical protein